MKLRRFGARRDAGQDVAPDSAAPEAQHTCPQCGALVSSRAKTCAYCGADLAAIAQAAAAQEKAIEREKRAEAAQRPTRIFVVLITAVLVLIILAVVIQGSRQAAIAALTPTITRTPTRAPLPTATPRASPTPTYTPTPLKPIEYVVKNGDTPGGIAALYDVSAEALMAFNGKQVDDVIVVGETLKIPIPTPTPTAMSTAVGTPATSSAPSEQVYTVKAGDTLSGIAVRFGVPLENIQHRNNIVDIQSLQVGQQLVIPLSAAPTSTPAAVASSDEATPTPPVQYPAVKLLTPLDREIFVGNSSPILLQWLSSGILRLNESYRVEIEQLGSSRPVQFSVTHATSFHLMPDQFPPPGDSNRTFRWGVSIVRKAGTDSEGGPIYAVVSPISQYSFEWLDVPPTPTATATPLPGSRPAVLPSATPSATPK